MKKRLTLFGTYFSLLLAATCYCTVVKAQVKIGNNPALVNSNAILELETTNKGLLLPRISLAAPSNPAPLSAFINGMVVYNTVTTDSLFPGVYYSDGIKWMRLSTTGSTPSTNNWSLNGNSGTTAGNFLGTTDMAPLSLKTNNTERVHISPNGWIGIGTNSPTAALQIKGQLVIDSLTSGNTATDSLLVINPADGRVRAVSAAGLIYGAKKKVDIVATAGQTVFTTPDIITDANKISLYRNGILISFTVSGTTSIVAEIACAAGDEIRIVQLL